MNYYFAPMEGITGYLYRNAYEHYFGQADKYFSPFISPNQNHKLSPKELKDVMPDHNQNLNLVPQILSNQSDYFIGTARALKNLGYEEVNLNLGCPSGTVVSKKRGSGFLAYPEALNRFLGEIFESLDMKISIKTRLGKNDPEEFYHLLELYNQYPICELIIHPRVQTDFYKNKPNMELFGQALELSKNPICYNGNLFSEEDYRVFTAQFPEVSSVMLGRGLIGNPGLLPKIRSGEVLEKEKLRQFLEMLTDGYMRTFSGEHNVLFKMKELWFYMSGLFTEGEMYAKKIRKAQKWAEYQEIVTKLFQEQTLRTDGKFTAP